MLYLIGSAHSHIGPSKKALAQIYDKIKPDVIMSETSEGEALVFESQVPNFTKVLQRHYPDPTRIPEIIGLLRERYIGFEYCFNLAYAQQHHVQHICFDKLDGVNAFKIKSNIDDQISMLKRGQIDLVEESLRHKKRKEDPIEKVRKAWEEYERLEGTSELDKGLMQDTEESARDPVIEANIRKIHRPNKTLVGIIGAAHLLESPSNLTLYSKLKDLQPKRIYLFKPLQPQLE